MQLKTLNGVNTYVPYSRQELIDYALGQKKILVAVNAEKILNATEDLRAIINHNIGYPDGIGAVMALKKRGVEKAIKIPGCELWLDIIKASYKSKSFYLVGGKETVIQEAVSSLKREFEGINILNYRNGYVKTAEEQQSLINDISDRRPDVVFVAMGSPKQELLMNAMQKRHSALYQGLGGSFDVYTGNAKRAPQIFQKLGLEWSYRLLKEPKRIFRQRKLVVFFFKLMRNKL